MEAGAVRETGGGAFYRAITSETAADIGMAVGAIVLTAGFFTSFIGSGIYPLCQLGSGRTVKWFVEVPLVLGWVIPCVILGEIGSRHHGSGRSPEEELAYSYT